MTSPAHPAFDHQVFDLRPLCSAIGYVRRQMATPIGGFYLALAPRGR